VSFVICWGLLHNVDLSDPGFVFTLEGLLQCRHGLCGNNDVMCMSVTGIKHQRREQSWALRTISSGSAVGLKILKTYFMTSCSPWMLCSCLSHLHELEQQHQARKVGIFGESSRQDGWCMCRTDDCLMEGR
jgi:hypothetical protein